MKPSPLSRACVPGVTALAVALVVAGAKPALAQTVYRWEDDEGEVHYTDDRKSIPPDKLKSAKVTRGAEIGIAPSADRPTAKQAASAEAQERARLEEEEGWRSRFRQKRAAVERLEKQVQEDRKALEGQAPAGIAVRRLDASGRAVLTPEQEAAQKRLEQREQELAKAREALAGLEREAASKAVPLDWRR